MRHRFALTAAALFVTIGTARASTLSSPNSPVPQTGRPANLQVSLNETASGSTGFESRLGGGADPGSFTDGLPSAASATGMSSDVFVSSSEPTGFAVALPIASQGYTNGSRCTVAELCSAAASDVPLFMATDVNDGQSSTVTVVPAPVRQKPSGLLLLGTGVVVLGSFMRRQKV